MKRLTLLILLLVSAPVLCRAADISVIKPQTLQKRIDSVTILDARPKSLYQKARIPGALSFSWEDHTGPDESGIPYRLPPAPTMARKLAALGINGHTPVAVYGSGQANYGGEGWCIWVLAWLGHQAEIMLLDGGLHAWETAGFRLDTTPPPVPVAGAVPYQFTLNPDIFAGLNDMTRGGAVIIDTRSFLERLKKRIPGSRHISWKKFFKPRTASPLAPPALRSLLADNGITEGTPVIYYCTGGIRSAWAWLVHTLAGYGPAANFEGGMVLWEASR